MTDHTTSSSSFADESLPHTHPHGASGGPRWLTRRVKRMGLVGLICTIIAMGLYWHTSQETNNLPSSLDELSALAGLSNNPPYASAAAPSSHASPIPASQNPASPYSISPDAAAPKPSSPNPASPKPSSPSAASLNPAAPLSPPTGKLIPITTNLDPTRVALLLETRPLTFLPALLSHFISVISPDWVFRFVGSPVAIDLLQSAHALSNHIKSGKLVLTEIPPHYPIISQEGISATLTSASFYADFLAPAEWLLVFQADSMVCAASKHKLEDWTSMNYTYVGAPWNLGVPGGNGGLSLRHVPPILELLRKEPREAGSEWEDRWLCDRLPKMEGANMPGPEIERHFSVEGVWTERPFGYHLRGSAKTLVPDIWGNETRRQEVFAYCPEVKIVIEGMDAEPSF